MKFQLFIKTSKINEELHTIKDDCFILSSYQKEIFKVSLDEKAMRDVSSKVMKTAIKFLTKKFGIKDKDLQYIGFTDLSFKSQGSKLLQFNIMKKSNPHYGSTVAYKYIG